MNAVRLAQLMQQRAGQAGMTKNIDRGDLPMQVDRPSFASLSHPD